MSLDLGLVDAANNPANTGGLAVEYINDENSSDDDEPEPSAGELELELLPDYFGRVSALLSTADGSPTALCKAAHLLLLVGPLFSPPTLELRVDNPIVGAASVGINLGCLLSGAPALHSLQLATRQRHGLLARLGAKKLQVSRVVIDRLRKWHRLLGTFCAFFMLFGTFMFFLQLFVFHFGKWSWSFAAIYAVINLLWLPTFLATIAHWWLSLKFVTALIAAPVAAATTAARTEARRLQKTGEAIDAERWRTEVEMPTLRLAEETMPVLSKGWGTAVGCVAAGTTALAMSFILIAYGPDKDVSLLDLVYVIPFTMVPPLLAIDPATASSKCTRLEDQINIICGRDTSFAPAMVFLQHLKALNKDQGLGFVVFGQVVTKRTLWLATTAAYGVMAAFGPTLLTEAGLRASCGGTEGQHAACPYGWTFADDTCFKLFGNGMTRLGNTEGLEWTAAEEACHNMGMDMHLASITSVEQQRAVVQLASAAGGLGLVWIGLNDKDETGSWVWSDDEPLEYSNWIPGEPTYSSSTAVWLGKRPGNNLPGGWGPARLGDEGAAFPYICGKKATPIEANGGDMIGCAGGHWVMGETYTASSTIDLPSTTVFGIYDSKVYSVIAPVKVAMNETAPTAAACAALVYRDHPTATAAEYSNTGEEWCRAAFDTSGIVYDPVVQTCLFVV